MATATDYLILRGDVLYTLTWTQTTQFQGAGQAPAISYDITSSGVPVAATAQPPTLPAGYWDPAFKDPVKLPNPLYHK